LWIALALVWFVFSLEEIRRAAATSALGLGGLGIWSLVGAGVALLGPWKPRWLVATAAVLMGLVLAVIFLFALP
jgi:hypothetical protein